MAKKLIGVIGYFATGISKSGGQEAKTCSITAELEKRYGKDKIIKVDTLNWKTHPLRLLKNLLYIGINCRNVVMLPAHKSVRVFTPILSFLRKMNGVRIHYAVVGGWLPEMVRKNASLKKSVQKIDYIYVETSTMQKELEMQGFSNVVQFPNFKNINPLIPRELFYTEEPPYCFCYFARVHRMKGLEDAVRAVKTINKMHGKAIAKLDIYGPIQPGEDNWFKDLSSTFDENIIYKGFVEPEESIEVLKKYYGLIFPTHYMTEGIPGTVIDAYAAGIPIISSIWKNSIDILDEGNTSIGYEMGNVDALVNCIEKSVRDPKSFNKMKLKCLEKAKQYQPEIIMEKMFENIAE